MAKRIAKIIALSLAVVVTAPLIAAARLEGWLTQREDWFTACGALLSLVPGRTGNFLRLAFYRGTLRSCGRDVCLGFGSMVTHRHAEIGSQVTIGAHCRLGTVHIEDHVLIASQVNILSGGRQHDAFRTLGNITELPPVFERVTIGTNTWIGEGAIILANVGARCVVAAGSVVFRQVPESKLVMGNPARVMSPEFSARGRKAGGPNAFAEADPVPSEAEA
jgi:acetyltransferase-like isoleucine patch superfamily enzyme